MLRAGRHVHVISAIDAPLVLGAEQQLASAVKVAGRRDARRPVVGELSLGAAALSLGAGNAVFAYDNPYDHWVAGDGACYFRSEARCAEIFDTVLGDAARLAQLRAASRARHGAEFTWGGTLAQYEALLMSWGQRPN
jgi:hypothetical protein